MTSIHVILLAGGSGSRMRMEKNKVLLPLSGVSVIARSAGAFRKIATDMIVVVRPEDREAIDQEISSLGLSFPVQYAEGGNTRQTSVRNGLALLMDALEEDIVLIHDAARCLVDAETIQRVLASVRAYGSGIPALPVVDTIKRCDADETAGETLPREWLRAVQTPQGFTLGKLRTAMAAAERDGYLGTDDASLVEHMGERVHLTKGDRRNIKLTTREDLRMSEWMIGLEQASLPALRVGQGYDVHQLVDNRPLILCGVQIPHDKGLLGHSDADVALHALMDALLGAAAMGDIGQHFPDSDDRFKGISSLLLLKETVRLLAEHGLAPSNVDLTIIAQKPKLAPYIPSMRKNVAEVLGLPENRVSVKATTTEHLGFEGRMEGISAQAVCLVLEK